MITETKTYFSAQMQEAEALSQQVYASVEQGVNLPPRALKLCQELINITSIGAHVLEKGNHELLIDLTGEIETIVTAINRILSGTAVKTLWPE